MHLGRSSYTYPLDAADLARTPDYTGPALPPEELPSDPVLLLIRKDQPDTLLRGRERVIAAGNGTVEVRIVFVPTIARWNILFAMVRSLRDRRKFRCSGIYHIAPEAVRQRRIERALRTFESAQSRGREDRAAAMRKLETSLREQGYDDSRPINVMLCRSRGEDSLRQGHHRVSACLACGIPKMAIRFSAAAAMPQGFWRFIGSVPVRMDVLKGSVESSLGEAVKRIVPLGDHPVPRKVIVVPENGRRFVLNLVPDSRMPVGIARALIIPVLVIGAITLDMAVLKTACGEHSLVAWSQGVLAALAALVTAHAAVREPRGRAGYLAMTALFTAMSVYEILRDVFDYGGKEVDLVVIACAAMAISLCALVSWRTFRVGLKRIACAGGSPALPFGFVFVWGISKLASSRLIWGALHMTEHDLRTVKRVVEESTELFGYTIIASWAISFFLERLAYRERR